jgi:hypothetical protein
MQAEQTRHDILAAARRRFATQGYAATSLKDGPPTPGVGPDLYDSIGSKADLVRRLNDLVDIEANVGEIAATVGTEKDPRAIARIPARITRRLLERCDDILRAAFTGAQAEPELSVVVDEGGRRHRAGAASVAGRLAGLGALRPGLNADDAATTRRARGLPHGSRVVDDHHLTLDESKTGSHITARTVLADNAGAKGGDDAGADREP